ncbi:MAG: sigma-54-dependent Fis family transcriptional regulator [Hydrogenophilales bacterium 17-61-9]|nr:MAG: sigma-54-dependent Fis family transcriptional regulator [Hydrogenophilales bacterium 17-61-9]
MAPEGSGKAALHHARRMLLESGTLPGGLVGDLVARSWRRSFDTGLAPVGRLGEAPHLSAIELERTVERQQELIAHARPVMEYLHGQIRGSGCMAILADERGVLLDALGDVDFLSRAERVALMPGASWLERYRGTNAIGTALAEGAPVVIHGAEHYLERNAFLTCAAAPVVAPDGRLLGVLDISGEQRSRHPHTFGLVRAAAQMVENRLFDARHGDSVRLRFHPLAEGIGTVAEGVVALSEDGWIVGANQAGLALLGLATADLGATPLERVLDMRLADLIDWSRQHSSQPRLVNRQRGGRLFVRVESARRPRAVAPASQRRSPIPDRLAMLDTGDARIRAAIERASKVLGKSIPLLLFGESGVGKGMFVRALHESGPRQGKPFVTVNCAALPETLIEAELFGYVPGAFTGARREGSPGRIREAHGGTLFLDEIGDMPLAMQARLLCVLQERKVTPLGGGKPVAVDFALVCATHRELKTEMETGRFRADLYYRINGLTLALPALRERSDFPVLLARLIEAEGPGRGLALDAALAPGFADYAWPGNLRQLCNVIRTACALLDEGETNIGWRHLPDDLVEDLQRRTLRPALPDTPVTENLRAVSDAMIARAVRTSGGNMSEAARRLGISRNTLYRRRKRSQA